MEIYPIPIGSMEIDSLGTLLRNQSSQNSNGDLNQLAIGENQSQSQEPHSSGIGIGELLNISG
jgi:hypothetical protein